MVDPSKCPIPPGFELLGNLDDRFDHFKDRTGYKSWEDIDGNQFDGNMGISKRWKNPHVRSRDIVCGFQFKIGPNVGQREQQQEDGVTFKVIGDAWSGDVGIHFPRRVRTGTLTGGNRGGYRTGLKWYTKDPTLLGETSIGKEFPHGEYGLFNYWTIPYRGMKNPKKMDSIQIKDGEWHSILAVCYNDWHRDADLDNMNPETLEAPFLSTSSSYPTVGLWYNHTATFKFEDFMFLGKGIDLGNLHPNGPLLLELGEGDELVGGSIFEVEHDLQIRIDDVQLNQIEIQNVYAAPVEYVGITPPSSSPTHTVSHCRNEFSAFRDAHARAKRLEQEGNHTEHPTAMSDLRDTEFFFLRCLETHHISLEEEEAENVDKVRVPTVVGASKAVAEQRIRDVSLKPISEGPDNGRCNSSSPAAGDLVDKDSVVFLEILPFSNE